MGKNISGNMFSGDLMLRNHILHRVHEGESLEGVAGCASLAPLIEGGWNGLQCELWVNVTNVAGARLKNRRRGMNKHTMC